MLKLKLITLFVIIFLVSASLPSQAADNSFGVSPATISNAHLLPGSHYEEEMIFSRADPAKNATALIIMDNFSGKDWIKFEPGLEVSLPKGEQRVPVKIIIDVPAKAAYGEYQGSIMVKLQNEGLSGQVVLAPAVSLTVSLTVSKEKNASLKVLQVQIPDFNSGKDGNLVLRASNQGNVAKAFSKITLDIKDLQNNSVKQTEITTIKAIEPFKEAEQQLKFAGKDLVAGEYHALVEIFDDNVSSYNDTIVFSVLDASASGSDNGIDSVSNRYRFGNAVMFCGIFIIVLTLILLLFLMNRKKRKESKR